MNNCEIKFNVIPIDYFKQIKMSSKIYQRWQLPVPCRVLLHLWILKSVDCAQWPYHKDSNIQQEASRQIQFQHFMNHGHSQTQNIWSSLVHFTAKLFFNWAFNPSSKCCDILQIWPNNWHHASAVLWTVYLNNMWGIFYVSGWIIPPISYFTCWNQTDAILAAENGQNEVLFTCNLRTEIYFLKSNIYFDLNWTNTKFVVGRSAGWLQSVSRNSPIFQGVATRNRTCQFRLLVFLIFAIARVPTRPNAFTNSIVCLAASILKCWKNHSR